MADYLRKRSAERVHVVVHLSGAHAYGFPSPDSDLDLKAIHIAPTEAFLGLSRRDSTVDQIVDIEGVEVDYTSNELGPVLSGVLKGNGNYLERILGTTSAASSDLLLELQPIVARSVSRLVAAHYRGFAFQQRRSLAEKPTAKRLLYVLRTALTGIHALRTGVIDPHLPTLAREYHLDGVDEVIVRKRKGEQVELDEHALGSWQERLDALFVRLDEEVSRSPLPAEAPNFSEVDEWLVEARRRFVP
ncbi:MAG: nucleotidyltransferase domain-containing protein [Polyangiaceae bacterium]|nr:nucleotidyltransferase domain-containing protein [Polyangiaceae bacterium]